MLLRNRHSLWLRLVLVLGAMGLFVFGYQWGNQYQHPGESPSRIGGVLVRPPAAIPDFELSDPFGQTLSLSGLKDHWTLMAFGDLSQASGQRAVQRLVDARNRVADQRALSESLELVLVATRDAPALARDFARLSPALHILGGDRQEVERLQAALGSSPSGQDGAPTLFLFDPAGHVVAVFPPDEAGNALADDLKALFAHAPALTAEQL